MRITLITIGKIKNGPHDDIATKYIDRIKRCTPFEYLALKNENEIMKRTRAGTFLVLCDEQGRELTSVKFAEFILERQNSSTKYLAFAIGPAEGFSEEIKKQADMSLAFSKFTLQHDMATTILLEQIYRAYAIIKGEPYHK